MIHYIIVSVLIAVSTFLVRAFLSNAHLLPAQASLQAETVDWLFGIHINLISFLFSLIVVFLLYSIVVFRKRKGDDTDGPHMVGNARLEMVWTAIPLGIVLVLAFLGAESLAQVEAIDPDALRVNVISSQWAWRFEYPGSGIVSPDLYLPVNQQVLLLLQSTDVIHSFWVPEFRVKQDALPGGRAFIRELRITPNKVGNYEVRCSELCGTLHYAMIGQVIVLEQADFDAWVAKSKQGCDLAPEMCGQQWATNYGCFGCHSTDGSILVGPSWQGLFGSTVETDKGSFEVDDAYLLEAITDPNARIHAGFPPNVMPQNYKDLINEKQLQEIIAFIKTLQ